MQHSINPALLHESEPVSAALAIFLVVPHAEKGEEWVRLGNAAAHADGRGFNLELPPLPLDAKVVLRDITDAAEPKNIKLTLAEQVDAFERATIERCLAACGGKVNVVMAQLNVPRRTLSEKMVRLGIDRRRFIARTGASAPRKSAHAGENAPMP
jgi:transcriptional regulator with GAF, ATPase, and Fis domain